MRRLLVEGFSLTYVLPDGLFPSHRSNSEFRKKPRGSCLRCEVSREAFSRLKLVSFELFVNSLFDRLSTDLFRVGIDSISSTESHS